jgi:hypothetical protein
MLLHFHCGLSSTLRFAIASVALSPTLVASPAVCGFFAPGWNVPLSFLTFCFFSGGGGGGYACFSIYRKSDVNY